MRKIMYSLHSNVFFVCHKQCEMQESFNNDIVPRNLIAMKEFVFVYAELYTVGTIT